MPFTIRGYSIPFSFRRGTRKSEVKLSIFVESEKTDKVWIRLWNNEKEKIIEALSSEDGIWQGTVAVDTPCFWYYFIVVTKDGCFYYSRRNDTDFDGLLIVALVILFKSRCMKSFPFLLGIVKALCTKSSRIGFIESGKVFNRFHMTKHSIK